MATEVRKYAFALAPGMQIDLPEIVADEAGRKIDQAAKQCQREKGLSYAASLERVLNHPSNETVVARYLDSLAGNGDEADAEKGDPGPGAGAEIDALAHRMMTEKTCGTLSYAQAVQRVLRDNPSLAAAYAGGPR